MPVKGTQHRVPGWQGRAACLPQPIIAILLWTTDVDYLLKIQKFFFPQLLAGSSQKSLYFNTSRTQSKGRIVKLSLCLTQSLENWAQNFWKKSFSFERLGSLWKGLWVSLSNCKPAQKSADTHHTRVKTQTPVILHCCSQRFVYVQTGFLSRLRGQLWQLLQERCCTAGETGQPSRVLSHATLVIITSLVLLRFALEN